MSTAPSPQCRVTELERRIIRNRFEERFTAERMARDYLGIYDQILADKCDKLEITESEIRMLEPRALAPAAE